MGLPASTDQRQNSSVLPTERNTKGGSSDEGDSGVAAENAVAMK